MAEIDKSHPLWEPAAALYGAWIKNQGLAQMLAPQFHNAPDYVRDLWIGVAQVAKDLFSGYQDELVDKIDQIYAVVRQNVSATKWEKISRRLAGLDDQAQEWDRHAYAFVHYDAEVRKAAAAAAGYHECDDSCTGEQYNRHYHPVESGMAAQANLSGGPAKIVGGKIVGGPAVLPGVPPFSKVPLDPSGAATRSAEHAHARINALQGELAWWLTCIEAHATGKNSNEQLAAGRSDEIAASFHRADARVANEQGWQ